jgi:hypothetical protein
MTSKSSALKMEQIECSETSANINQTPGKCQKVSTLDTEHGESLKSRIFIFSLFHHYTSTCFGFASSPSSGGNDVYMQTNGTCCTFRLTVGGAADQMKVN